MLAAVAVAGCTDTAAALPPSSPVRNQAPDTLADAIHSASLLGPSDPGGQPRLPPSLAEAASGVGGLDDFSRYRSHVIRPGGLTPTDVRILYGIDALTSRGLDGSGETIVLPEIDDLPNTRDLAAYARSFGLPPFDVAVKRDVSNWGRPH